ncbi:MAG: ATP-binding cassette domain-containing protein [Candidatus Electryonea clarkiae]|nr:ATP-binding cassette domain-containing protein [Candidatus Electryonea clarkiae]MDP8286675.1 ATP-binding cassette domain-containing protein [Candidatus Electryonea clarkiae]
MIMTKNPLISIKNLTVRFGDNLVLDDISFDVYEGEIFVILGESGCGKTTLLRHMLGLLPPENGEVLIDGVNIVKADEKTRGKILKNVGVLFQSGALLKSLTLGENIALPLRETTKLPKSLIDDVIRLKLGMVNLDKREHLMPSEMSGGMQKRGGLARAIALDPKMLFFDEPSAGLDPITSVELDDLIIGLNKNLNTTMIVVTHELQSIFKIAHRTIMLDRDSHKIVAEGKPLEMRDNSDNPRVRAFFRRENLEENQVLK